MRWSRFSTVMGAAALVAAACCGADGAGPKPAVSGVSPSWEIRSTHMAATASARPDDHVASATIAASSAASGRFLHVALRFDAAVAARRLHRFRITDGSGRTVAEPYGYHDAQSRLVFQRAWEKLDGLYLEGLGRRVPLTPSAALGAVAPIAANTATTTPKRGVLDTTPATTPTAPPPRVVVEPAAKRGVLDVPDPRSADAPPPAKRPVLADAPRLPAPSAGSVHDVARPDVAKTRPPKKLYQEVIVAHASKYQIQGLDAATTFRYRVLSSLESSPGEGGAHRRVVQTVEAASLLEGDAAARGLIAPLVNRLVGTKFQIDLDRDGRVAKFEGDRLNQRVAAGPDLLGGQGLVLASLIDRDGWKEISELTFFQPQAPWQPGRAWQRDVAHSWGPLGRWNGPADFLYAGKQDGLDRVTYRMALKHSPPAKADGNALPFELANVAFKHDQAGGALFYDPEKRRVARAEETFHVRGSMEAVVLGQRLPLALDERQQFLIRVYESPGGGSVTPAGR